ncbi:dihydroneopterin aldolase [Candidatus Poriferisodalis sp.]|uniref:dihydroneopterin aldolase n=1 Tax=Candidatus Poriferisodalis sp. TaxID=3101277 RepID=UPI003C6FC618
MTAPSAAASDASPLDDRCVNDASPDGDRIELRDLRVMCVVGALAHERTAPQPLSIDVDLYADLSRAGASDNLADTIDYGGACDRIVALCATEAPQLLERLAELIAADLCSLDAVTAAAVTVTKLRPAVAADLATSAVRITRRRPA